MVATLVAAEHELRAQGKYDKVIYGAIRTLDGC
jgi:hypothetical protein